MSASAGELIGGTVLLYPTGARPEFPPENTTKVLFDFDHGLLEGPPETDPDQHGRWREQFDLMGAPRASLRVSPQWHGDGDFVAYPAQRDLNVPGAPKKIRLSLWEPRRLSQNLGGTAASTSADVASRYSCAQTATNEKIAACWAQKPVELTKARAEAQRAIDLFERAHSYDPRPTLLWQAANLQVAVADFCAAADSFARIDVVADPGRLPVDDAFRFVYESDARIQCARGAPDGARRRELIIAAARQAESAIRHLSQGSRRDREQARRILGNWLLALRLLSDKPHDDLEVAAVLRTDEELHGLWDGLRSVSDQLYERLDFRDAETSSLILAHRIGEVTAALASRELPAAPAGVGGSE